MKVLVGTFNQEKTLVGAFSMIVKTDCETDGSSATLDSCVADLLNNCAGLSLDTGSAPHKGYMSPPSFWAAALLQATEERWIELLVTE